LNKNLKELIGLSKIDRELDSFSPQLDAIDAMIVKSQEKVDAIQEEISQTTNEITENSSKIKAFEDQIEMLSEQIKSHAKKSKDITTEKEMKALSMEEDIAKEKLSFANEEIDRINTINEKKTAMLQELENQLTNAKEDFDKINADNIVKKEEIEQSKTKLYTQRDESARSVEQKILAFYEKIRTWAGNSAVVPVRKQACYGCYMKISDKAYSEVIRSEEIITCPHCGRILFVESESTQV
jgi:predicted  nucleic acid-binding Zn-ribbon protein